MAYSVNARTRAISILLFYPADKPEHIDTSDLTVSTEATTSIKKTASSLVSRFFNGSVEDKSQQIQALENTLTYLQQDKNSNAKLKSSTTNIVLNALQNDNIQHAFRSSLTQQTNKTRYGTNQTRPVRHGKPVFH